MANPTCSQDQFQTVGGAYAGSVISPAQRKALRIYAMILQLQALGGTDYRTASGYSTLQQDAATLAIGMTQDARDAARVAIDFANATAAGASVPATLDLQLAALGALVVWDAQAADQALLLLKCKLGVNKAFPQ
jgi:hypothetical protein